MTTVNLTNTSALIEKIDLRLQALEEEKSRLLSRKTELESATTELAVRPTTLSTKDKVALFQKLFGGRDDIFALRWENKAGKSGYALAYPWRIANSSCRRWLEQSTILALPTKIVQIDGSWNFQNRKRKVSAIKGLGALYSQVYWKLKIGKTA